MDSKQCKKHKGITVPKSVNCFLVLAGFLAAPVAVAIELVKADPWVLNLDISAGYGVFHSSESYAPLKSEEGSVRWNEGYYKAGFSGSYTLAKAGQVYGAWNYQGTGTWKDGDAAGKTTGDERRNAVEDAYVGWRSGNWLPFLGEDGVDVSLGRQKYKIGNGFLIDGDTENLGKGSDSLAPKSLDRGGTYYMASRQAFNKTALFKLGKKNWRGEFFWLESDNPAQADTELFGTNLMWVTDAYGTVGLVWLHGRSVDDELAEYLGLTERDGQDTFSLRYSGSAGVENLVVEAEYATQDNGDAGDDRAWYLKTGWKFADTAWKTEAGVRYSSFSNGYDPLFDGFSTGYGTWFQGEVAGNYAGPFNSNADVWHGYVSARPMESLSIGVLYFDLKSRSTGAERLDAYEIDLYAEWQIADGITFSPLIGFYTPDKSAEDGGSQIGNDNTNVYLQAMFKLDF